MKTKPINSQKKGDEECSDINHKELYKYKDDKLYCPKCKKPVKIIGGMYYYVKR